MRRTSSRNSAGSSVTVGRVIGGLTVVTVALVLAGCGGGSAAVDVNGFSNNDRVAAQAGLDSLKDGQIPRTLVQLVIASGLPAICTVHAMPTNPKTFKLFLAWKPLDANAYSSAYIAFGGVVGERTDPHGFFMKSVSGHTSKLKWAKLEYEYAAGALNPPVVSAGVVGPAWAAKPAEPCVILANGDLVLKSNVKNGWYRVNL